jgi:hypothetical protein
VDSSNGNGTHPIPSAIRVDPTMVKVNAGRMRLLTAVTGRTMDQLFQSDEPADRIQALAFFELAGMHLDATPAELWELAGSVDVVLGAGDAPDPFGIGSSTVAPPSAGTGDSTPTPSTL